MATSGLHSPLSSLWYWNQGVPLLLALSQSLPPREVLSNEMSNVEFEGTPLSARLSRTFSPIVFEWPPSEFHLPQ